MSLKPEPGSLPPLQLQTITKDMVDNMGKGDPYMMRPLARDDDGESIVKSYNDPQQRITIQKDTIDGRVDQRQQYKNQVFKAGWNLPTKTLEELGDEEYADAMRRQQEDQERDMIRANEDPESEEVLERERIKKRDHEDWADGVPKGRGITKRI